MLRFRIKIKRCSKEALTDGEPEHGFLFPRNIEQPSLPVVVVLPCFQKIRMHDRVLSNRALNAASERPRYDARISPVGYTSGSLNTAGSIVPPCKALFLYIPKNPRKTTVFVFCLNAYRVKAAYLHKLPNPRSPFPRKRRGREIVTIRSVLPPFVGEGCP